jgi:hypothetical protein
MKIDRKSFTRSPNCPSPNLCGNCVGCYQCDRLIQVADQGNVYTIEEQLRLSTCDHQLMEPARVYAKERLSELEAQ